MIKSFNEGDDIVEVSRKISILDPLRMTKIDTPVRSSKCTHLQVENLSYPNNQCFDLETFITSNFSLKRWRCPVCRKEASFSNLEVDSYFQDIINSVSKDTEEVVIQPDGTWKVDNDDKGIILYVDLMI